MRYYGALAGKTNERFKFPNMKGEDRSRVAFALKPLAE